MRSTHREMRCSAAVQVARYRAARRAAMRSAHCGNPAGRKRDVCNTSAMMARPAPRRASRRHRTFANGKIPAARLADGIAGPGSISPSPTAIPSPPGRVAPRARGGARCRKRVAPGPGDKPQPERARWAIRGRLGAGAGPTVWRGTQLGWAALVILGEIGEAQVDHKMRKLTQRCSRAPPLSFATFLRAIG
jgi:hypothetical protein